MPKVTTGSKFLPATVQISRASGGRLDDMPMHITVTDEISGCRVCELYMALDQFALALTSSEGIAQMEWYSKAPIGMKAENKSEFVPLSNVDFKHREQAYALALKPFEIDGWEARRGDMGNHHRGSDSKGYEVVFFRHVNPETGAPV